MMGSDGTSKRERGEVSSDWEWFHVHAYNQRIAYKARHNVGGDKINGQGGKHDILGTYIWNCPLVEMQIEAEWQILC